MTHTNMTQYTVFDPETGSIVKCGSCIVTDMQLQCEPGQIVVEGRLRDDEWRWDDDALTFVPVAKPAITVAEVKEEAARRLGPTDWYVTRAADPSDGTPVPDEILAARTAVRVNCDLLLGMNPIPLDYRDDSYWL